MDPEREKAETLALTALGWLAGREDLLDVFMGATGSSASDLRNRAAEPEFLAAVLDFLLMDDAWVLAFSDESGVATGALVQARQALPGGEQTHWT
ncbi:MAG: DUF3572 domain-containing protein [Pseudomonadota bacterium]